MIEFEAVTRQFGDWTAIDALSLTVPSGSLCVLIGPSGSGKSTLLRMINRLIEPTAGEIRIAGEPVLSLKPEDLRRRIGYAIQSIGLFPHWTVERNIATVPSLLGWPKNRIRDRVTELLTLLHLDPEAFRTRYPHQLSGGQAQRIGVARALAAEPDVLLMDEPFAALDPLTRAALQNEVIRIHRETGTTIVFVTHDRDEALRLGQQIVLLDRGRIVQVGSPREILTEPATDFVRTFIGGEDSGLRLLALETVAARLRPAEPMAGEPVSLDLPLAQALSLMLTRQVYRLAVANAEGQIVGSVHLTDLVRAPGVPA